MRVREERREGEMEGWREGRAVLFPPDILHVHNYYTT